MELSGHNGQALDLPATYKVINQKESAENWIINIQGSNQKKPNELLAKLITQADVHSFREILPTMNDIFIANVNAAGK